jgi:hypothetical protein
MTPRRAGPALPFPGNDPQPVPRSPPPILPGAREQLDAPTPLTRPACSGAASGAMQALSTPAASSRVASGPRRQAPRASVSGEQSRARPWPPHGATRRRRAPAPRPVAISKLTGARRGPQGALPGATDSQPAPMCLTVGRALATRRPSSPPASPAPACPPAGAARCGPSGPQWWRRPRPRRMPSPCHRAATPGRTRSGRSTSGPCTAARPST